MHAFIFSLRDVSFFGFGIYFFELFFSIYFIIYCLIKKGLKVWVPLVRIFFIMLLFQLVFLVLFQDTRSAPMSIVVGPTINILFAISLYLHLNDNEEIPSVRKLITFLCIYLALNIGYWLYEVIDGAGAQNFLHSRQGDQERTRMLNTEPSYLYTPFFVVGVLFAYILSSAYWRFIIIICTIIVLFTTGAKTFVVVILCSGVSMMLVEKIVSKQFFLYLIIIPFVGLLAFNNEQIKSGLIDPLMGSGSDLILDILNNSDSENVGSFQTRILSLYGGVMTFLHNPLFGVGPSNEHIHVASNILNSYFFNPELIDAAIYNEFAITSKGYVVTGVASYGVIWLIIWFFVYRLIKKTALQIQEVKFLFLFLFFSSLITEGTNYPALIVLILTYAKIKRINRLPISHEKIGSKKRMLWIRNTQTDH